MNNLITLKIYYQNKDPSTEQNDKKMFINIWKNFDYVCY